jgi:uncharacterized protein YecE (DUF72 family)
MTGAVRIGTSGWHYDHWRGTFYPEALPKQRWLAFYARHFDTVEINNSFYRLPTRRAVEQWRQAAPAGFSFAIKASRYTTHVKRLKDAPASFTKFFAAIAPLAGQLGPILFQTPPRFAPDAARLDAFIAELPEGHCYAFEFRDPRWFNADVRRVLERRHCAFCIFDIGGLQSPLWRTADFTYLRLHGPGEKYSGSYAEPALRQWARRIRDWRRERDVWCFFDNDEMGYAAHDAARLKKMLSRRRIDSPAPGRSSAHAGG